MRPRAAAAAGLLALWTTSAAAAGREHFLIDFQYVADRKNLFATMGYLVVFNPGDRPAEARETFYFEDRSPETRRIAIPPRRNVVESFGRWPVRPNTRFAIRVESEADLVCQATSGWENTNNDERPAAKTRDGGPPRESASSYVGLRGAAREWLVADGIVIDAPGSTWVRESETVLLLNPGPADAAVRLEILSAGPALFRDVVVPALRLSAVTMDSIVPKNRNYSARITSDRPIAAQWRRDLYRAGSDEPMSFWSVPAVRPETRR